MNNNTLIKTLNLPISKLPRIGPTLNKFLSKLINGQKIFDLLLHKPLRIENISLSPRLFECQHGENIIIKVKVEAHQKPTTSKQPYKVICYHPTGYLNLVFFRIYPSQIQKMKIGEEIIVTGTLEKKSGDNQIIHPNDILSEKEAYKLSKFSVIYPLCAAISQKFINQKIKEVLTKIKNENIEFHDKKLLKQLNFPNFNESLEYFHYFHKDSNNCNFERARRRLAFDELLAWQIATLLSKRISKRVKEEIIPNNDLSLKFIENLPFSPTAAQINAISRIRLDIYSSKKMLRLLQGDVGSGKTIVAIASCLQTISKNQQSCIIAPTTVLAKQHLNYFQNFLKDFNLNIEILTSAVTKKQKEKILTKLANGEIDILIGTHALIEDNVIFKNLGLAIIDEQHRFGVMQRLKLTSKGKNCDILLMSATPIPRSLMMALYSDMEISILDEKPANRQEIETLIKSGQNTQDIFPALQRAISKGEKIYWICPAISYEDSEEETKLDSPEIITEKYLVAAKDKFAEISKIFGEEKTALIHGKMKDKEKDKIMNDFKNGEKSILVATTVIEVGIDVPQATVILVENSENFGLAQLHQLRGRVGRSDKKSYCILLYGKKFGKNARERLNILKNSNDGFFIAEEDLKMRGSGELLGTKQSGFPEFRIADLSKDSDLLKIANQNTKFILNKDKNLQSSNLKDLLKLFSYDDCLKIIFSG